MPTIATLGVDGLVRGDRVEPRSKPSALLKSLLLEIHLQERRLKHILRHLGAAEIATEVTEQLLLVTVHKRLEGGFVPAAAEPPEQFLIGGPTFSPTVTPVDDVHRGGSDRFPVDHRTPASNGPLGAHRGRGAIAVNTAGWSLSGTGMRIVCNHRHYGVKGNRVRKMD